MLSNYCINNRKKYGIKTGGLNKLIPDLGSKKRQKSSVTFIAGNKLIRIHRILKV